MGLFSIFVELAGRLCLVVGGGAVGTRKVLSLLAAGARVSVVSREVTPELRRLIDEGKVACIGGSFTPEHLAGVFLCVSAMDERTGNEQVAEWCRERGVLVNVVDEPALSDFFFPSVVRRGDLVIAVSSGGVAPSMIKRIRQDLEAQYGQEYESALRVLGRLRVRLREAGVAGDGLRDIMERAAALPLAGMISSGKSDRIAGSIRQIVADGGIDTDVDFADLLDREKK
jgi:precorrin-2 dehydrogenase / sirohydrochlorin ferrochelatase